LLALLWRWQKKATGSYLLIILLCIASSYLLNQSRKPSLDPIFQNSGQVLHLRGKILEEPVIKEYGLSFAFRTKEGYRLEVRASFNSKEDQQNASKLLQGAGISFQAKVLDPQRRFSDGASYQDYLLRNRFHGAVDIEELITVRQYSPPSLFYRMSQSLRSWIRQRVDRFSTHEPLRQLLKGMLLGDYPRDSESYAYFQELGLAHFLAVSGYHFYFLLGILMVLLFLLGVMSPHREWIILGILALYLIIGGFQISALRAFIMSAILLLAIIYQGRFHAPSVWCFSAFLLLLWNPWLLFQAGFQLSFLGSLLIMELGHQRWGLVLMSIPMMALSSGYFHTIQPWSILTVSIFSPLLALFFLGAWLSLLSAVVPFLPLAWILEKAYDYFYWLLVQFQSFPWSYRFVAFPGLSTWSLLYALTLLGWILYLRFWEKGKQKNLQKITLTLCLLPLLLILLPSHHPKHLEVNFLDIGQGDAIFIQLPERKNILIDAGPGLDKKSAWDPSRKKLLPFLRSKGINKIDYVVLSHFHDDHYGGLKTVFEHIPQIDTFIYPAWKSNEALEFEKIYQSFNKKAKHAEGICVDKPMLLGNGSLCFYGPPCDPEILSKFNENDRSLVLQLKYGATSILFTGDMESASESDLISRYGHLLQSSVLKVAHHGSSTSSSEAMLDTIQAKNAVISCGKNNRFGHPSGLILDRFNHRNIPYYITHETGNILLQSNGKQLRWHLSIEP
jgi:competence protein ComEC